MAENRKPQELDEFDDELATFADLIRAGKEPEKIKMSGQSQELTELEDVVTRLERAFQASAPDRAVSGRIRSNLAREWANSGPAVKSSFWSRWFTAPSAMQPRLAAAVAGVIVVALLVLALPIFGIGTAGPTTGSAGNIDLSKIAPEWFVGGGIVFAAFVGVLWLALRRKR
jgi:hypothetical protein